MKWRNLGKVNCENPHVSPALCLLEMGFYPPPRPDRRRCVPRPYSALTDALNFAFLSHFVFYFCFLSFLLIVPPFSLSSIIYDSFSSLFPFLHLYLTQFCPYHLFYSPPLTCSASRITRSRFCPASFLRSCSDQLGSPRSSAKSFG